MQSFIQIPASGEQGESPRHPVLHCAQIDSSNPQLIRALVASAAADDGVVVWIPYAHILCILEAPLANQGSYRDKLEDMAETDGTTGSSDGFASA